MPIQPRLQLLLRLVLSQTPMSELKMRAMPPGRLMPNLDES
jgi:hypothetical protein